MPIIDTVLAAHRADTLRELLERAIDIHRALGQMHTLFRHVRTLSTIDRKPVKNQFAK
jgi:hypothetical protein